MKYVLTIIGVFAVLVAGAFLYAWSGIYNIAATEPHWSITSSLIDTLLERSVEQRSERIQVPNLNDEHLIEEAFTHYHEMCRLCHGAYKYPPLEFSEGLYPAPPSMTSGQIQKENSEAEIYWIVKHGIKMTGMPAFSLTHDEEELWGLVAVTKKIPRMTPDEYQELLKMANSAKGENHVHSHTESKGKSDQDHEQEKHLDHNEAKEGHH